MDALPGASESLTQMTESLVAESTPDSGESSLRQDSGQALETENVPLVCCGMVSSSSPAEVMSANQLTW